MKKLLFFGIMFLMTFAENASAQIIGYARSGVKLDSGNKSHDIVVPMFVNEQGIWLSLKGYTLWSLIVRESDKTLNNLGLSKPESLPTTDEIAIDSTWDEENEGVVRFVMTWPPVSSSKVTMEKKSEINAEFDVFYKNDKEVAKIYELFNRLDKEEREKGNPYWELSRNATIYSVEENAKFAVLNIRLETGDIPEWHEIVLEKTEKGWQKLFTSSDIRSEDITETNFKLKYAADVNGDGKTDYIFALNGYNFDGFMLYNVDQPPVIFSWVYH